MNPRTIIKYLIAVFSGLAGFLWGVLMMKKNIFPYSYLSKYHDIIFTRKKKGDRSSTNDDEILNTANKKVIHKLNNDYKFDIHIIWGETPIHARLIRTENKTILLGCGTEYSKTSPVVEYLDKLNINEIDYVAITMYDHDHVGGLPEILNEYRVNEIVLEKRVNDEMRRRNKRNVERQALQENIDIQYPELGEEIDLSENISLKKVSPRKTYNQSNTNIDKPDRCNSTVYKLSSPDLDGLLMSDAQIPAEIEMVESGIDLSSDFLIVGHHGYGPVNNFEFLDHVNPKTAIIDAAYWNKNLDRQIETESKLQYLSNLDIYITNMDGSVVIQECGGSCNIETSLSS